MSHRSRPPGSQPQEYSETRNGSGAKLAEQQPSSRITRSPDVCLRPELFLLGSSQGGRQIASQLGLGFACSFQINPAMAAPMLREHPERSHELIARAFDLESFPD